MALANITIFIAQAAALVILIFALVSYIVYKVRSRKEDRVWEQRFPQKPVDIYKPDFEITYDDNFNYESPIHAPVFSRMSTNSGVHQRVTTDDLISMRVVQARDSRPKVVKSSYERPKEKVQMVQNWA